MFFFLQATEAMRKEIGRLDLLVNGFDFRFNPYPRFLEVYKKVKITCVDSFTAKQQLQWKNNLKLNTITHYVNRSCTMFSSGAWEGK